MDAEPVEGREGFCLSSRPSHTTTLHDAGTSWSRSQSAGAQISIARPACVMATRPHRTESTRMQGMQPPPDLQLAGLVRCPGQYVADMSSSSQGTRGDMMIACRDDGQSSVLCVEMLTQLPVRQDKGLVARFDSQNSAEWASTGRQRGMTGGRGMLPATTDLGPQPQKVARCRRPRETWIQRLPAPNATGGTTPRISRDGRLRIGRV
ncbi:hypothetical protein B0T16DRAFT_94611 [Cercophora newfieldiana]|uniref:Uncharacterized protein n=1 Tax=Cercophora newfieldiana TaxID=92897 RepID=A0AA39YIC8_9PEZI|nr:hypothetical protein B0T16DRAFT_94611 [Cercophora newfieldiana]